jgi:hypothetical protein
MNNISLYSLILLHWSQLQLIWTINITTLKVIAMSENPVNDQSYGVLDRYGIAIVNGIIS